MEKTFTERKEKRLEDRLRKRAIRMGYRLKKSRASISIDNHGGFMIIDLDTNFIVDGERFDVTLDDVKEWFSK